MAKTIATTTLPPFVFVQGLDVLAEHQRAVAEQQNFAAARRPVTWSDINCLNPAGYDAGSPAANRILFDGALNVWDEVVYATARIPAYVQSIRCTARCQFAAAETGEIRFTIGAGTATVGVSSANNGGRVATSILTSASGTGRRLVLVEIRRTAGGVTNAVINIKIQSAIIAAADLPDPANT